MIKLRDIAEHAGVSAATASRALAGNPNVNKATRERVEAAARELGYRPNAVARGLRTQRTDTIGLLLPDIRNPFFTELAYHVDKAATRSGLTVMTGSADEQADQQDRYLEALARHQVDGIIAVPQGGSSKQLRETSAMIPTVFLDRDPQIDDVPCISSDDAQGMRDLVDHLVRLGRRRIGVVAGPQSTSTGRNRLSALRDRLAEHGLALAADDVVEGNFQLSSGISAAERLLDSGEHDALIAADNLMALGALQVLRRRGIAVGEQVALACVDDQEWFGMVNPPITVVAQDAEQLGRSAVECLVDRINGSPRDSIQIPMTLIPRASCGETRPQPHTTEVTHG